MESIVNLGQDILANKYYELATCTILFYDYFLTLADEVRYIWSGKKTWIFWLFVFNRYFPMTWQFWQFGVAYSPQSKLDTQVCEKTAWYSLVVFVICTLVAQVALTTRIYAMTMKSVRILICFVVITSSQSVLGIGVVVLSASKKGLQIPSLPLDTSHLCVFYRHRPLEIAYTSISLLYDSLAFSFFIFLVKKSRPVKLKVRMILDTIAEDAVWYFLVIFTSHFVFLLTLTLARTTIQLLPATGIIVFLPVMISRIILSLKKAGASPQQDLTFVKMSHPNVQFVPPRDPDTTRGEGDIPLEVLHEPSTTVLR